METENVQTLAEIFNQELVNKAKMGQFSSDSIVTFPEIPLVVPRYIKPLNISLTLIYIEGSMWLIYIRIS